MIDLVTPLLVGVIVFLLAERLWYSREAERRRKEDLAQQLDILTSFSRQSAERHAQECDRLMSRSMAELKSWQSPEQREEIKPVDMSWMTPDFTMSVEDIE